MKVLDLQCAQTHVFEGWFASEQDFVAQSQRALVQCPVCGDPNVVKKLSAPRLSLSGSRNEPVVRDEPVAPEANSQALAAAWLSIARQIVAHTTDVGAQFAQEARKMHYGEAAQRSIRGTATRDEALELVDEGIAVIPLALPPTAKETLQ